MIGGALSHPAERFPGLFRDSEFLKTYPYFLPCAVPATFSIIAWIVTYLYLKEVNCFLLIVLRHAELFIQTNPTGFSFRSLLSKRRKFTEEDDDKLVSESSPKSVSLGSLLTPRVLVSAGNYALLSLVDIAYRALQPLFYSTPLRLGGLGLPPHTIGICLAILGFGNGIFQVLFFADIHKRVGTKRLYQWGIYSTLPIFLLFPIMSLMAREWGVGAAVWVAIGAQLALTIPLNVCYGMLLLYTFCLIIF